MEKSPIHEYALSGQDDTSSTILEFASYLSSSRKIIREIRYLAMSKLAFEVLIEYAVYGKSHHRIGASSVPKTMSA